MDHYLHSNNDNRYFYATLVLGLAIVLYFGSKLVSSVAALFGIKLGKSSKHGLLAFRVHSKDIDSVLFGELWILRKAYWPTDTIEHYRDFVKNSDATFVIFRDSQDGSIRGCFCEQVRTFDVDGQMYHFIYFGNLFTYTYFRGSHYIGKEVTKSILRHYLTAPRGSKCIFVFGAMSYKIYLVTARIYPHQFYPDRFTYGHPEFDEKKKAVGMFMGRLYPQYWDEKSFLIRLKGSLFDAANISDDMLSDPDIKFFKDFNPDYSHGNAIACFFEISLHTILLTVYKLVLRALRLDGAKKVQQRSVSKKASKKFAKEQDLEKAVKISMTQRDIARTYVLPRETELSRTFQLSDKLTLAASSDILRNSSESNGVTNNNNESQTAGNPRNSVKLKNSGKTESPTQTVGSAELKDLEKKAEEVIQKQNEKKNKVKSTVNQFGKHKKN